LVSTHWSKPSDFQSELLQREESCYDLILWEMSRNWSEDAFPRGVLSSDYVHMFVSVPPKIAISDLVRKMKGRSSRKMQREFPALRRRYWGRRFWGRGYSSTTNGVIVEDVVLQYLENHIADPTDLSR